MKFIPVLVTGTGGGGVGESCAQALRLARTRYRIIGTDASPHSIGIYAADRGYLVPAAQEPGYINRMIKICRKEKARALIPGTEPELMIISKNRDTFEKMGVLPLVNSPEVIDVCQDKWKTFLALKRLGLNTPKSAVVKGGRAPGGKWRFPVILKPYRGGGGSKWTFLARNHRELEFFIKYLHGQRVEIMAQEYLGSADEEYTVGVLTDMENGSLISSICLKRRVAGALSARFGIRCGRSVRTVSSGLSQGEVGDYPDIRRYAEKVALRLGSRGPLNVQCRRTSGRIYIFEINPRHSGTTALRAMAGINEPDILIRRRLLGDYRRPGRAIPGLYMRGIQNTRISPEQIARVRRDGFI